MSVDFFDFWIAYYRPYSRIFLDIPGFFPGPEIRQYSQAKKILINKDLDN
jgi:hypothetical protein